MVVVLCFFFKQKTAYEIRISDWSSDVCSSDLHAQRGLVPRPLERGVEVGAQRVLGVGGGHVQGERRRVGEVEDRQRGDFAAAFGGVDGQQIGRASCRERVCQYV